MKILILLLAVCLFSCSNNSTQKKAYQDSANMMLDSMDKYKPMGSYDDDSTEIIRKGRYQIYEIMYRHYKELAEK